MEAYDIVGVTSDGNDKIKFTNNEFKNIIFSLGKVYFTEDEKDPRLNFHYEIHMHDAQMDFDKEKFEETLAGFIVDKIRQGLEDNDLIYTGGLDED
jgi:hypothetical protein